LAIIFPVTTRKNVVKFKIVSRESPTPSHLRISYEGECDPVALSKCGFDALTVSLTMDDLIEVKIPEHHGAIDRDLLERIEARYLVLEGENKEIELRRERMLQQISVKTGLPIAPKIPF
jgi:hypothetical protein